MANISDFEGTMTVYGVSAKETMDVTRAMLLAMRNEKASYGFYHYGDGVDEDDIRHGFVFDESYPEKWEKLPEINYSVTFDVYGSGRWTIGNTFNDFGHILEENLLEKNDEDHQKALETLRNHVWGIKIEGHDIENGDQVLSECRGYAVHRVGGSLKSKDVMFTNITEDSLDYSVSEVMSAFNCSESDAKERMQIWDDEDEE